MKTLALATLMTLFSTPVFAFSDTATLFDIVENTRCTKRTGFRGRAIFLDGAISLSRIPVNDLITKDLEGNPFSDEVHTRLKISVDDSIYETSFGQTVRATAEFRPFYQSLWLADKRFNLEATVTLLDRHNFWVVKVKGFDGKGYNMAVVNNNVLSQDVPNELQCSELFQHLVNSQASP